MFGELKRWKISLIVLAVLGVSLLAITPVLASDSYSGENVVIDEDTDDDVYANGQTITVNATIDGDLIAVGGSLTVNGTVTGDVIFAGQSFILNGEVQDDVRFGGTVLVIEDGASIGDDLNLGGYALEMQPDSAIGGDVYIGAGQAVLSDVGGDITGGVGSVRIIGDVGGDVELGVGSSKDQPPFNFMAFIMAFMPDVDMPSVSSVPGGLSFGPDGHVAGDLKYSADAESDIPKGVVGGVTDFDLEVQKDTGRGKGRFGAVVGFLGYVGFVVGGFVLLLVTGLIIRSVVPNFLDNALDTLRTRTWASLGVGFLGYAVAYFVAPLVLALVFIVLFTPLLGAGGRLFSALSMIGSVIWTGFRLGAHWLAPVLIAALLGGWIYSLFSQDKEKKAPFWELAIGLLILVVALGIPFVGRFLLSWFVGMFGLGAVVLTLWPDLFRRKPAEAVAAAGPAKTGPEADKPTE